MPRTVMAHFAYVIEFVNMSSTCAAPHLKSISPCVHLSISNSFEVPSYCCRAVHKDSVASCEGLVKSDLNEEKNLTRKKQIASRRHTLESVYTEEDKEVQKAKKIGHGNKGKRPWNKGIGHSEETRERIRRKTKEALQDPKVRKKMSEAPRTLTKRTKARIRASLIKLWAKRLKWKRSREKFMRSWAQSIAKAAKIGGSDQEELEWNSYETLEQEMRAQQIYLAEAKSKAKEIRRAQAAQARAEKMERLAQRREQEEKARISGVPIKKRIKRSKEEKEKLAESKEVKLKERLMKIRKKKTVVQVSNQDQQPWEKLDIDLVKMENLQKEVSLADQIRLAKKKKREEGHSHKL